MKYYFILVLILASLSTTAQLSESALIGKWKVSEVVLTAEDPGTRQLYQGFKDALFVFSADHHLQFSSPSTSRTFGLIATKLATNDWVLEGKNLRIGSKADHFQTMQITIDSSGGNTFFVLEGTPVRLRMVKQ
ncbi:MULTISPECIES: hypothetical protein [unclassified Flavobacterium]|uniref:hypothetical protein n=1 Tax=unclassified Flavobacterium TaxID=196869 RepID=UPI001F144EDC|nr:MULTISPECIES: hypothetical protein [unclassified Flavobacterium]UMY64439.1 hypothetical protein MKO97_07935 [Flavobacterium sp. HJ-32-4]